MTLAPVLAERAAQPHHCGTCARWEADPEDRWMGACELGRRAHGWHNGGDPDAPVMTHCASPCAASHPKTPLAKGWLMRRQT